VIPSVTLPVTFKEMIAFRDRMEREVRMKFVPTGRCLHGVVD
jgi:hypothetical protein